MMDKWDKAIERDIKERKQLLSNIGWTDDQIERLIDNASKRYKIDSKRIAMLAMGRAHDLNKDGFDIENVISRFAPEDGG